MSIGKLFNLCLCVTTKANCKLRSSPPAPLTLLFSAVTEVMLEMVLLVCIGVLLVVCWSPFSVEGMGS